MTERVKGGKKWRTVRLPEDLASAVDSQFRDPYLPFYAKIQRLLDSYDLSHPKTAPAASPEVPA